MNQKSLLLLMVALVASFFQSPAYAQEGVSAPQQSAADEAEFARLAGSRNRESMRDGESDVLVTRGISEGDNDFRAQTPALQKSAGEVAMVDIEELRERALAMYAEGATFDSPPRIRSIRNSGLTTNYTERHPAAADQGLSVEVIGVMDDAGWGWITPLLCFFLVMLFLLRYATNFRVEDWE